MSAEDQVRFFGKLAAMMEAGVPMLKAFDVAMQGVRESVLRAALGRIVERAYGGTALSEAFDQEQNHFTVEILTLLRVGEEAGDIEEKAAAICEGLRTGVFEAAEPEFEEEGERPLESVVRSALDAGATDIHVEPGLEAARLRFRVQGALETQEDLTPAEGSRIVLAARRAARLAPKDRIGGFDCQGTRVTARFCAYEHGEGLVLGLGAPGEVTLDSIGLAPEDAARIRSWLDTRDGIVIVTGPRECGKTTTLAAMLAEIDAEASKVLALDPAGEIRMPGVERVLAEPDLHAGLAAAAGQDADVVYLAEVPTVETAELAVATAGNGRLLLTCLHAWGAPEALSRLVKIGVDADRVAELVRGVVGQRLLRAAGDGGRRVPVYEVMDVSPSIWRALRSDPSPGEIRRAAVADGMVGLGEAAMALADQGLIDAEEVERTLGA